MTTIQNLGRLAQTGQSLALVGENLRAIKRKKIKTDGVVKLGVKNIVGTELIRATGTIVGTL